MNMNKTTVFLLLCVLSLQLIQAKNYSISSPDQKIKVFVSDGKELKWSVQYKEDIILKPSRISMTIKESDVLLREKWYPTNNGLDIAELKINWK